MENKVCAKVLLVAVVIFSACAHLATSPEKPDKKIAIVFVPGFKGSHLRDPASGDRRWLTTGEALRRGKHSLTTSYELTPDGVMESLPFFGGLWEMDIYGSALRDLRAAFSDRADIVPFAYDWRMDLSQTVDRLGHCIETLHYEGYDEVWLVAHSMGGLVSAYYLRYGKQDPTTAVENWEGAKYLNKVVFAGVPFRGAIELFLDLQSGIVTGRNTTLLDRAALVSMPAAWALMPWPGVENVFTDEPTPQPFALYDANNWELHHWSLFDVKESGTAQAALLRTTLARTAAFYQKLHAPVDKQPSQGLRLLNILSRAHATPERVFQRVGEGAGKVGGRDRFRIETAPGDGLIPFSSAELPSAYRQAFPAREVLTESTHGDLFRERKTEKLLLEFLKESS